MKKDILVAFVVLLVVAAVCYGLAVSRPAFQPTPSQPFTLAPTGKQSAGLVVMRVNGEPITEGEFNAAFHQLPDQMQQQYASEPGKMAFAEQLIRLKLLEQEAHKMGLESDPKVDAVLAADRMNVLAGAAADKLAANPSEEAVQSYYSRNREQFEALDLSHIVIAYDGSLVHPRNGKAPSEQDALNEAMLVWKRLKAGADFANLARQVSDDQASAARGGELGEFTRGMLPPEIDAKIFALKPGAISEPMSTRFGIHIFKVNSRTNAPMSEVRGGITQQVRQQSVFDRVQAMRREANVEFDSKFFPSAPKPAPKKPS